MTRFSFKTTSHRNRSWKRLFWVAALAVPLCAADSPSGTVRAWGLNDFGQLGNNSTTNSSVPVPVSGLSGVVAVGAGGAHSLAVKSDGTVWAWGDNTLAGVYKISANFRAIPFCRVPYG